MLGWLAALLASLAGTIMVWYYRSHASPAPVQNSTKDLTSLLKDVADKANSATKHDQEEANNVLTAKEASDFLNSSAGTPELPTPNTTSASTRVRAALRPAPSRPISGFARGPGYYSKGPGNSPGALVEGGDAMARSRFGVYEEWC